jgi:integrase
MSAKLVRTQTPGVYKRGRRYCVIFRDATGRQRRRAAPTYKAAKQLKASLQTDVERGEFVDSRITFTEYAPAWIATYKGRTSRGIRPETIADYRAELGLDADGSPTGGGAVAFFGRSRLSHIRPADIKAYAAYVEARGVSAGTVRLALAPVKCLLADAFEEGLIRSNPAAGVRVLVRHAENEELEEHVKALSEEELRKLLATLEADPEGKGWDSWWLFFAFLAHTGMRISEAIALLWRDVDLGRRRVRVRRRYYQGGFAAPKSKYGRREIPLSPGLARALWELRKERRAQDGELVFTSRAAGVIDQSNLMARVLKPAARMAGVGGWPGFHTFRHTAATMLFRGGANAKQVQLWLGHHSPAFTLATYVHLLPDDLPEADFLERVTTGVTTRLAESGREAEGAVLTKPLEIPDVPKAAETASVFS